MAKVKICGITNLNDAQAAIDAGADALGFNFYDGSSRYIAPAAAGGIVRELSGAILKVGVFVNASIDRVIDTASVASLEAVQLHGDETTAYVDVLRSRSSLKIIKAFRVSNGFIPEDTLGYNAGILLDGFTADARGGTGQAFDWEIATLVRSVVGRLWLAGGLSPENVRAAILEVSPYAVDACSSLESGPGIKDHERVRKFIIEAKAV